MRIHYRPRYDRSLALVIGIDAYQGRLPPLTTAVRGAEAVAAELRDDLGFEVILLRDREATRDAIYGVINGALTRTGPDDRVLIYFAGHGITRTTTSGAKVGYLVPHGADAGEFHRAIEMADLVDQADFIPAKHILFLLDACFSGMAFTRAGEVESRLAEDLLTRRAVQAIAAGQQDQLVADTWGPGGHSIFTGLLLDRLRARNGLLTANELGLHLQRQVGMHTRSRQTPHYGHLLGSQGGDFILWQRVPTQQAAAQQAAAQQAAAQQAAAQQAAAQQAPARVTTVPTTPASQAGPQAATQSGLPTAAPTAPQRVAPRHEKAAVPGTVSGWRRWRFFLAALAGALPLTLLMLISDASSGVVALMFALEAVPYGWIGISHLKKRRTLRGVFYAALVAGLWLVLSIITIVTAVSSDVTLEEALGNVVLMLFLLLVNCALSLAGIIWALVDAAIGRFVE
ncbi:MAG: hypothetical protein Kow00124_25160 [Anaerolineae bacterium]